MDRSLSLLSVSSFGAAAISALQVGLLALFALLIVIGGLRFFTLARRRQAVALTEAAALPGRVRGTIGETIATFRNNPAFALIELVHMLTTLVIAPILAFNWVLAAIVMSIFGVTFPFADRAARLAVFVAWPFGQTQIETQVQQPRERSRSIGNVLWVVLCGWWLAAYHFAVGVLAIALIIEFPFGIRQLRMVPVALFPLDWEIVALEEAGPTTTGSP
jgi:uncharacterized membrane protein YccF (DUF307 family)